MNLLARYATALAALLFVTAPLHAALGLTNATYSQNFNSVNGQVSTPGVYAWTDDTVVPGWHAIVNGMPATQYRATNGGVTSTSPAIWLARTSGTEAALGVLAGAGVGVSFVNNSGGTIAELEVNYRGEQWSHTTGGASTLACEYSVNATSLTDGNWTSVSALAFASPKFGNAANQALDGNAAGNNQLLTATISGLSIGPGQAFWIRWSSNGGGGQALAVDDLSVSASSIVLQPVAILPNNALQQLTLSGPSYGSLGAVYPVSDASVTEARLVTISQTPPNPTDTQLKVATTADIAANDVVQFTFYLRPKPGTDEVRVDALIEQNASPYDKAVWRREYAAGDGWKRFDLAFVSPQAFPAGTAVVRFRCGYKQQSFDIAGISVTSFGQSLGVDELPNTITYGGQDENAAWRAEAEARIEQYRKGDLAVEVKTAAGIPISNASVTVNMVKNAFGFGSAVPAASIVGTGPNDLTYRNAVLALFNQVTLENDLKWPSWEVNSTRPVAAVDWLKDHGIAVRGHNLIWPKLGEVTSSATGNTYYRMPADCIGLSAGALRTRINTAFHDRMSPLVGELLDWDVLNEPSNNYDIQGLLPGVTGITPNDGILGNAEMQAWFALARQEDPYVNLYLNDNKIGLNNAQNESDHQYAETVIHYIKDAGYPIDGLGIQGHFKETTLTDLPILKTVFDRYAMLGVRLKITEFDFYTRDQTVQAQYLRDVLTLAYSHPAMDGFLIWGFWDGNVYLPGIGLFEADWTRKPAGDVWAALVGSEWRTNASGTTDTNGRYEVRSYTGDYVIGVSINGAPTVYQNVTLSPDGATVTFTTP